MMMHQGLKRKIDESQGGFHEREGRHVDDEEEGKDGGTQTPELRDLENSPRDDVFLLIRTCST